MQTAQIPEPARAADLTPSPTFIYEAAKSVRQELRGQLDALVSQRHGYLRELEDHDIPGPARSGMEQRIIQIDLRIAETDKLIAAADAQVAKAASVPGAVVEQPSFGRDGPPREMFIIGPVFVLALLLPVSIAMARRIWKRGTTKIGEFPREMMDRLARLEQMGEATSLEVERIGEGQRFVTRLLTAKPDRIGVAGSTEEV